jgi:hypothetical protein
MSIQKQHLQGGTAKKDDEEVNSIEDTSIVKPIVKIQDALNDLRSFEQMKSRLLSRQDYQPIQGKNFIKKSGWRKLALVFNISDEVVHSSRETRADGSFVWTFRVRATAPNGRYTESVASCDSKERKFSHLEHDVLATAQTRAKSRAISDLIGAGEISAEELSFDDSSLEDMEEDRGENATMERLNIPTAKKISEKVETMQNTKSSIGTTGNSLDRRRFELKLEGKPFPIQENEGPFTKFFVNKICKGIEANHPPARFELERNDAGQVIAVMWEYLDGEKIAREISSTLDWTVRKVVETRSKTSKTAVQK